METAWRLGGYIAARQVFSSLDEQARGLCYLCGKRAETIAIEDLRVGTSILHYVCDVCGFRLCGRSRSWRMRDLTDSDRGY